MENGWILVNNDKVVINHIKDYLEKESKDLAKQSEGYVLLVKSKEPITTMKYISSDLKRLVNTSTNSSANTLYKTINESYIIKDKFGLYSLILFTLKYKDVLPIKIDIDYDIAFELGLFDREMSVSSLDDFKKAFNRIRNASKTRVILSKLYDMGKSGELQKEYEKRTQNKS